MQSPDPDKPEPTSRKVAKNAKKIKISGFATLREFLKIL